MKFSEKYSVSKLAKDDWFDPILYIDTKIFIDPFLIFQEKAGHFAQSHKKILEFFNKTFKLLAKSGGNPASVHYKKAVRMLRFPEVEEICLGYSSTTGGAGSGGHFSRGIADAIWLSIQAGKEHIDHFEELSIFNEGIAQDRVSDMTANLLKKDLIEYTQSICKKHNVPMESYLCPNADFDFKNGKWLSKKVNLPINHFNSKPIILVPERFLNPLPSLSPEGFWNYMKLQYGNQIREDFSMYIKQGVSKKAIVALAKKFPERVGEYISEKEQSGAVAYDLMKDPLGLYQWHDKATGIVKTLSYASLEIGSQKEFVDFVEFFVSAFKRYVEKQDGASFLWNRARFANEKKIQSLFWAIIIVFCQHHNIDCSKEVNQGSGPVDFKFSQGYRNKVVLEVKKVSSTQFWEGLELQTRQYMEAEGIKDGIFLAVASTTKQLKKTDGIQLRVDDINKKYGTNIRVVVIDGRKRVSASKLRFN